jgi:hypothetical protein
LEELSVKPTLFKRLGFFEHLATSIAWALRLIDQSSVRAKDVNEIWEALGDRLSVALLDRRFSWVAAKRKKQIFKLFVKDREQAHRGVFDAAEVLNPKNLLKMMELFGSTNALEMADCIVLKKNTLSTLLLTVNRRIRVEFAKDSKSIFSEEYRTRVEDLYQVLVGELHEYLTASGSFAACTQNCQTYTPEAFYMRYGSQLGFFALRILHIAATVSDIERLHKTYSLVHTAERNATKEERVDLLVVATIATREKNRKKKLDFKGLSAFTSLTPLEEADLMEFGGVLGASTRRTNRTVNTPALPGSAAMAVASENAVTEAATESFVEENNEDDYEDEETTVETVLEDEEEFDVPAPRVEPPPNPQPGRSSRGRTVRYSLIMREAALELGLSGRFFLNTGNNDVGNDAEEEEDEL